MIKTVCDICHREVKEKPGVNFCDRCKPFAQQFVAEAAKHTAEVQVDTQRKWESFRNRFLKDVVLIDRPKLEVVAK
jgi:hypothetical protein